MDPHPIASSPNPDPPGDAATFARAALAPAITDSIELDGMASAQTLEQSLSKQWEQFFKDRMKPAINDAAIGYPQRRSVSVDFRELDRSAKELAEDLLRRPSQALWIAEEALKQVDVLSIDPKPRLRVRIENLHVEGGPDHSTVAIRNLRAEHLGRLVAIKGIVKRITEVRPQLAAASFKCRRCGAIITEDQDEHLTLREPVECYEDQSGCGATGSFRLMLDPFDAKGAQFQDTQKVEVEESPEGLRGGEQPQRLNVWVDEDLCNKVAPGDRVILAGILRANVHKSGGVKSTRLDIFFQGVGLTTERKDYDDIEISPEEHEEIIRLSRDPDLYAKLRDSIAPDIYGLETEKEALLLQLFGGLPKKLRTGGRLRGEIHVLLVGDPGVAKSQLIRTSARIAPRGMYTSGQSTSAAGLTAAAVQDDSFGEGRWTLEAGAMVLADKGLCAIDEIDKMRKEDRSAMHEALEQQSYHPTFELLLANGERRPIGALVDGMFAARPQHVVDGKDCEILPLRSGDVAVLSFDPHRLDIAPTSAHRVSRHAAPDHFIRIRYANGREILVTPEHPVFVADASGVTTLPAEKVREGMWGVGPRSLAFPSKEIRLHPEPSNDVREKPVHLPDVLTADLAEWLGLLVAEGHNYEGASAEIGFSNKNPELIAGTRRLGKKVFGIDCTQSTRADGLATLRWISTRLLRWMRRNFATQLSKARQKRVPDALLACHVEIAGRYLRGAFSGDGCVESEAVSFATASKGLAQDYADLLLRLGIASRVFHYARDDTWKVYIAGDGLGDFLRLVVAPNDPRRAKIARLVRRGTEERRHHDVLPAGVGEAICTLQTLLGMAQTGYFYEHRVRGFGVQRQTVAAELERLDQRARLIRRRLAKAATIQEVRTAADWSVAKLAQRMRTPRGTVAYAIAEGYDTAKRATLSKDARLAVRAALAEYEAGRQRLVSLLSGRYLRIQEVSSVPNDGDVACKWVYDVTVEPSHAFVSHGLLLHNTVSIAKAGMTATLQARCAVAAAANPKTGRFDPNSSFADQIDLPPPLLSRFDLIFVLTDRPDAARDTALANAILDNHRGNAMLELLDAKPESTIDPEELSEALRRSTPPVPPDLFRKYVAFAKREIFPVLSKDAATFIREYYVNLRRSQGGDEGHVPLTARQLEAIVRLAEASARVRLSDRATLEDAERARMLVETYLRRLNPGEGGRIDSDVVSVGASQNAQQRMRTVVEIVRELSLEDERHRSALLADILTKAQARGIPEDKAKELITRMKQQGQLMEPQTDRYRVVRDT
ncbi:MAG: LAGLIDADG family homing endonuclease [Thermoplasmatota archaeon]